MNSTRFPDLRAMTDGAHAVGLTVGWYGSNSHCGEHQDVPSWGPNGVKHYEGDVQAIVDFGFDGIKLDNCGEEHNMTLFVELMNSTGRKIMVEECHWGAGPPGTWGDGGALNLGPNKVPKSKWYVCWRCCCSAWRCCCSAWCCR